VLRVYEDTRQGCAKKSERMEQNGRKLSIWRGIAVRNDKQALTTHEGVKFAVYGRIFRSWRVPLCMCRRHGQGEVKKRDLKPRRSDGKRSKSDQESVRGCERAARAERVSTHLERQRAQANKHGARDALAQHQMCNSAAADGHGACTCTQEIYCTSVERRASGPCQE